MTSARHIVGQLGGKWRGRQGTCRCPAHEDRTPSMSVTETRDGRPLVHCFSGCTQVEVIDALRARGLWAGEAKVDPSYPGRLTTRHDGHHDRDDRERQQYARDLWDRSNPIKGTLAEAYLRSRGIHEPPSDGLGYVPRVKHTPTGREWPCMVAALRDFRDQVVAVQRTWLARDGSGKAPITPAKMTCGPMGHSAVKLHAPASTLGLAEGIETALSAKQLYQIPTWACLSASRLSAVRVPPHVEMVVIFADPGKVGQEEAFKAADYFEQCRFKVDVIFPGTHFGKEFDDFNAVLQARAG